MDTFDDLSFSSDDMEADQNSMFDPISQNNLTKFPNDYGFQKGNPIEPTDFLGFDLSSDFQNQDIDFLSHEIPAYELIPELSQDHALSNGYSLTSFHDGQDSDHVDMHLGQISFSGKYNDAEIEKMKDDVEHYQYVVDTLSSKVNTLREIADLAKRNNSFNADCKVDQLNDTISEYNNALSDLKEAKIKLNNAT